MNKSLVSCFLTHGVVASFKTSVRTCQFCNRNVNYDRHTSKLLLSFSDEGVCYQLPITMTTANNYLQYRRQEATAARRHEYTACWLWLPISRSTYNSFGRRRRPRIVCFMPRQPMKGAKNWDEKFPAISSVTALSRRTGQCPLSPCQPRCRNVPAVSVYCSAAQSSSDTRPADDVPPEVMPISDARWNCYFAGTCDCIGIEWKQIGQGLDACTRHSIADDRNDVFLDDSARPLQFNFRSNFHQIIDGCGRRERQDNTGE